MPERRAAVPGSVPELAHPAGFERPPGQVEQRRDDEVDRELADEPAHDADRAQQRERERDDAEEHRPRRLGRDAEQLVGERRGGRRDDDQLERRPAEALEHVQRGRRVRADAAERCSQQHHPRRTRVGPDQARRPRASRSRPGCRAGSRAARPAARAPARGTSRSRSRAARRRGCSRAGSGRARRAPGGGPEPVRFPKLGMRSAMTPFAGITRIRFCGSDLSLVARGTPVR